MLVSSRLIDFACLITKGGVYREMGPEASRTFSTQSFSIVFSRTTAATLRMSICQLALTVDKD